eukprot:2118785-Pleurochrysis_carterae.AAC.4
MGQPIRRQSSRQRQCDVCGQMISTLPTFLSSACAPRAGYACRQSPWCWCAEGPCNCRKLAVVANCSGEELQTLLLPPLELTGAARAELATLNCPLRTLPKANEFSGTMRSELLLSAHGEFAFSVLDWRDSLDGGMHYVGDFADTSSTSSAGGVPSCGRLAPTKCVATRPPSDRNCETAKNLRGLALLRLYA